MRPPKTLRYRRVNVVRRIGVPMVRTVVSCPPEDALLRAGLCEKRHQELACPTELVGTMAEISVIACGNAKHPNRIRRQKPRHQGPFKRHPEQKQTGGVQRNEGNNGIKMEPAERPSSRRKR